MPHRGTMQHMKTEKGKHLILMEGTDGSSNLPRKGSTGAGSWMAIRDFVERKVEKGIPETVCESTVYVNVWKWEERQVFWWNKIQSVGEH